LNLSKQFIFKLFKFIPIPNISFFINTSYDECLLRSDDILNKEIISKEIKNLKNLKKYCNNFHEINGNKDIKDVFIEVVGKLEKANLVKLNN